MVIRRTRPRWHFLSARDGSTGLQQAREHRPNLVLLDLQLPGMTGDVVLRQLKADSGTSHIPVLLLTADATIRSRERLLALGADDYLPKPFDLAALLERMDALLQNTRE